MNKGIFRGIGIGPGDPELISVKAVNAIGGAEYICLPRSESKARSIAYKIIKPYITNAELVDIPYSMSKDNAIRSRSREKNAERIISLCRKGNSVVFVTLGDPCIYSTFDYLFEIIKRDAPDIPVEIIPGISSITAASAEGLETLIRGEESLTVQPCRNVLNRDMDWWRSFDCIVVMKIGSKLEDLISELKRVESLQYAKLITNTGFEDAEITQGEDLLRCSREKGYLSVMLVRPYRKKMGEK